MSSISKKKKTRAKIHKYKASLSNSFYNKIPFKKISNCSNNNLNLNRTIINSTHLLQKYLSSNNNNRLKFKGWIVIPPLSWISRHHTCQIMAMNHSRLSYTIRSSRKILLRKMKPIVMKMDRIYIRCTFFRLYRHCSSLRITSPL